jgi:uncharacterized protein YjbI with pentapeptide repeats
VRIRVVTIGIKGGFMKVKLLAILTLAAPLVFSSAVQAGNPQQIQRLLQTGECIKCNLSGADLTGAHLIGSDLRGANLKGANLSRANIEGADFTGRR